MEEEGCNNTVIICRLDFQPVLALGTLPHLQESICLSGGQEGSFLEMSKKVRRVGDLEDIPDILWPVS